MKQTDCYLDRVHSDIATVTEELALEHHLPKQAMYCDRRMARYVDMRRAVFWRLCVEMDYPYDTVCQPMGFHHTTAMHHCQHIAAKRYDMRKNASRREIVQAHQVNEAVMA